MATSISRTPSPSPPKAMAAAAVANLNGASKIICTKPKPFLAARPNHRVMAVLSFTNSTTEVLHASRRTTISIAIATLFNQLNIGVSRAEEEGNGLWLDGPLPVPKITNNIANEETGTRSFLRNGIYMANIGLKGSKYRLRMYAFDLLALGDLLGKDAWSYVRKYISLKSTVMYYDFDKLISAAPEEEKLPLTDLANRLFDSVEKFDDAVKKRDDPMAQSSYADTTVILQEVMTRMA